MAENTSVEVDVAQRGSIFAALAGTALPTSSTAALPVAFVNVGHLADTGVKESLARTVNEIYNWGGDKVRDPQKTHSWEFDFTMLQTNAANLELYYGDEVLVTSDPLPSHVWVIDWEDGDKLRRYVLPDAKITTTGDRTLASADIAELPVHLSCYPILDVPSGKYTKGYRYYDELAVS